MKKILVIEDNRINKLFVKASYYIMSNYKSQVLSSKIPAKKLKELFLKQFNAILVEDNLGVFQEILFEKDKDYTVFMLRFS